VINFPLLKLLKTLNQSTLQKFSKERKPFLLVFQEL